METLIDRINRLDKQNAAQKKAGTAQVDPRDQAIIDRHVSEASGQPDFMQKAAKGMAELEIEARRKQREYADQAPQELYSTTSNMLSNLGSRGNVLDTLRQMTPEQRTEALKLAPGIAQQLGDDRGGADQRISGAVSRGISHMVSQPAMELLGSAARMSQQIPGQNTPAMQWLADLGGTPEEIEYIRQLDAAASQEFNPALPSDPWYERGPLQAIEMVPWMATIVGGGGLGRTIGTGIAETATGRAVGGALGRVAAQGGAKGAVETVAQGGARATIAAQGGEAGLTAGRTLLPGLTGARVGELAGISGAAFPGQYAQEVDQLKAIGMKDDAKLRLLAGGTAAVVGLIEGLVPNPLKAGPVPLNKGAVTAARQYLWEAAKRAPAEMSEEYLQGVTSGLGQHVAQYIASEKEMDFNGDGNPVKYNPVERKSIADAFALGWEQTKEAALPMAFLLGVPASVGAGRAALQARTATQQRLALLEEIRSKGFVSINDASNLNIDGKNRKDRLANLDKEIEALKNPSPWNDEFLAAENARLAAEQGQPPSTPTADPATLEQSPLPSTLPTGTATQPGATLPGVEAGAAGIGKGLVEGLYTSMYERLQAGQYPGIAKNPSDDAVAAEHARQPFQTPEEIRQFINDGSRPIQEQPSPTEVTQDEATRLMQERIAQRRAGQSPASTIVDKTAPVPQQPKGGDPIVTDAEQVPPSTTTPQGKEPWELTRSEHVAERERRIAEFRRLSDENGGGPEAMKVPEVAEAFRAQEEWSDLDIGHKPSVQKAVKDGKPVPASVLAEYPNIKPKSILNPVPVDAQSKGTAATPTSAYKPADSSVDQTPVARFGNGLTITAQKDKRGNVTPVTFHDGREIVHVVDEQGRGAFFYRSFMGTGGKQQGRWYPIGGLASNKSGSKSWLIKGDVGNDKGYGRPGLAELEDKVNEVLPSSDEEVSKFIDSFGPSPRALNTKAPSQVIESLGTSYSQDEMSSILQKWKDDHLTPVWGERPKKEIQTGATAETPAVVADKPTSPEDHAKIPMFGVYKTTFKGKKKFAVKEFENKGFGDSLFDTEEEARKQSELAKRQSDEKNARQEKAKADEEAAVKKQQEYEGSFQGFLSDTPMVRGRQLSTLGKQRSYQGKVVTVKELIEQKVADGAIVNEAGQLESTDGAYLGSDKITKIGIDYARHLIARKPTKPQESLSQNKKPSVSPEYAKDTSLSPIGDKNAQPSADQVNVDSGAESKVKKPEFSPGQSVVKVVEGKRSQVWTLDKRAPAGSGWDWYASDVHGDTINLVESYMEPATPEDVAGDKVKSESPAEDEFTAAVNAAFDQRFGEDKAVEEAEPTKPRKTQGRKDSQEKPEKKTLTEKAKDRKERTSAVKAEKLAKFKDLLKKKNVIKAAYNPKEEAKADLELLAATVELTAAAIDDGVSTFAEYVAWIADNIGKSATRTIAPYLEAGWNRLGTYDRFRSKIDKAGKVEDFLTENSDEIDTGSTRDGRGTSGARTEDMETGETEAGEVADAGRTPKAGNGSSGGLAGNGGRTKGKGSKSSGSTERGNEDVRLPSGPGGNYRIGDDERVGSGAGRGFSAKARFAENVKAIRLLKKLEEEGRQATAEEQAVLVKYVGWGGLKQAFGRGSLVDGKTVYQPIKGYESEFTELKELLTDEEWNSAKKSITNAHYTDPAVIRGMWQGLEALGFKGGKIVEPSAGTGLFFGLIPQSILDNPSTRLAATEIDSVSGRIAQQLYQGADIRVHGFEELNLADNSVDLFISNVPFGQNQLSDKKDRSIKAAPIHNFFFNKAIRKTRPGGLVAFITSRYSMDEKDASTREFWDKNGADLVGVVRLPGGAFKGIANTDVVTDIIILQKREEGVEPVHAAPWKKRKNVPQTGYLELVPRKDGPGKIKVRNEGDTTFPVNEYFEAHPEHVVGELAWTGTMQKTNENQVNVESPETGEIGDKVSEIIAGLPADKTRLDSVVAVTEEMDSADMETIKSGEWKEDHLRVEEDRIYLNNFGTRVEVPVPYGRHKKGKDGEIVEIEASKKGAERTTAIIKVFNAAERLIAMQPTNASDEQIEAARRELNKVYDAAVKEYGPLSSGRNATFARMSLTVASRLFSLEEYDPNTDTAKKAAVFTERTERPHSFPTTAKTAMDALTISLAQVGRLDPAHVAGFIGKQVDSTMEELGDLVFKNNTGDWELAQTYLSGNVRQKLEEAKKLAEDNADYMRNVAALEAVQPADLKPSQIEVRLGSPWIPTDVYQQFLEHLLRRIVKVSHSAASGKWFITPEGRNRNDQLETLDWGIARMPALEIITKSLNRGDMRVWEPDGHGGRVVNRDDTTQVAAKLTKIKAEFQRWLWSDANRADSLTALYNTEVNNMHQEPRDGSHLTFPGMSEDVRAKLDAHQVNAVWRYLTGGNMLLAHVVGAGKSWIMTAAAMEQKRISGNPSFKTMIAVPNHLVTSGQFVKEILEAYPSAKVLAATPDSLSGIGRRSFLKKMATGNYDIVVIAHSSFGKIPLNPRFEQEFIQKQINDLEAEVRTARADSDRSYEAELQTMMDNLRDKLAKMSADLKRDELSTYFDELNIDSLFVDEAHEFKNLSFRTRMSRVPGVNPKGSDMAFDMWMKTTYFNKATNEKNLLFATGTPIANAIAEMYTMQRYLQPSELTRLGLEHFDSWAASFADEVTKPEIDPAGGGMRMHSRLSQYINMPELSAIFRQVADVQTADMLVDVLKRPLIEGGSPQAIKAERNAILEEIIEGLQERAQRVRSGVVDKSEDNMLNIVTDGRKAATDIRLIDPTYPDLKGSKVNLAVENIHRIWEETSENKSTQVVWLDVTSPNTDYPFNLYHEIVDKLVALGIPREEIAIMHDYNEKTKAQLFRSMNKGDIRILLGSTPVMGTGVNVQKKLIASHHLDVPWRPDQLEQRDGRILRRGNTNKRVKIIRYISKGSFDSFMWDKIEQKSSFIRAAMSGASDRVLDASEAEDMSAAEMKAAAADDPNLIRFVTVQAEVNKLESEHRGFLDQQSQIRRGIAESRSNVTRYTQRAADFEAMVQAQEAIDIPDGEVRGKVGNVEFTDPKEFGEALVSALMNAPSKSKQRGDVVRFEYNGLNGAVSQWVDGSRWTGWFGSQDTHIDLELGDSQTGNVTRLNNAIEKIKVQPDYWRDQVEQNRLKIPALEKRIQAGWPDADKLSELRQEQATLASLVQSSGSDEHKQEIAKRIEQRTGREVIISGETGRYLWKDVEVVDRGILANAAQDEAPAVVPANIVDIAEGELTAERNRDREARLRKLRDEAEVYEWDRSVSPRPPKKKTTRKKTADSGESRSLDEFTSPELQNRQSMGAAKVIVASAADLVGEDDGGSGSQHASSDKEFERRWQQATKGIGKKTLATRLREFWNELVKSTVRGSLPELPRTEQFGEARSAMHAYQNAPAYAQLAAADLLKKTSKPLSASDYDLFTRVVIMRDQVEAADKGERLSYGLTPAKAKAELDRVEALAANNERVQASLEYRKQWTEAMVDDFLSAHEYLGLDMADRFNRENYFRHQVLYYMEAQQRGLGKKNVELTPNRGWLKGRTSGEDLGEAFDINANYLQAEWEVSTQMIADTKRAQAIGRLKRHYDKMRQLKEEAKYNNYVAVVGGQDVMDEIEELRELMEELRSQGSLDAGEKAQMKEWSERLWELDPTMPFRRDMAIARDQIERGASSIGEDVPAEFMRYVATLSKQDDSPLQGPALAFLKAISDRKAFIKNALGDEYQTWEDVVPDDHEEVAIRPGRAMFQAYSVPEQVASELMADLSKTLGISAEDLRPLTALGSKYTPLVVPQEVAAQMASIDNKMDFGWLDRLVTRPMSAWKRWALMGPTRVLKYNLRNLSEIDKVMALNPAAIKDIPQAVRDLWKLYSGAEDIPATVRDWVERGGSGTLVRINELGELNELKEFARLISDKKSGVIGKIIKSPVEAWKRYWSTVGIGTDFRESILRYAAYLNYVKQLEAGKLTNYGGSVRAEVDGIKDVKDKAMRLSSDLLGDYGDISLVGQFLRSRVAPFWSFQETNVRTYFRGLMNLASNEQSAIKAGMQVARAAGLGVLTKAPFLAYKVGRIAILLYGLKAITTAFNQLLFGDDDDDLPEEEKRKAHLTFGKNSKGEVQYFSRVGTAADVLDWVGLDSVDYDLRDVLDGRRTLRDVLNDMARSPVDKAYGMLSPFMKVPTELAVGQTAYPNVGKPRPIRDRGQYIAQNLGLNKEYDKLAGNPTTPYSVSDLVLYKVEPGTSAYYMTQDAKFRWLKTDRSRGVGYSDSVRGNALRSYKMALRLNDKVAADKYLAEYEAADGTKEGLLDSLESSHPAGGLSTVDAYLFYKSLVPVEQDEYRKAERFYYSELLTEDQATEIRVRRDKRLKDLAFGKNKDGSPKGKPEKQRDETTAEYQLRLSEWNQQRQTAAEAWNEFNKK